MKRAEIQNKIEINDNLLRLIKEQVEFIKAIPPGNLDSFKLLEILEQLKRVKQEQWKDFEFDADRVVYCILHLDGKELGIYSGMFRKREQEQRDRWYNTISAIIKDHPQQQRAQAWVDSIYKAMNGSNSQS